LDPQSSKLTAINFGATEISLIDENVKMLSILKPPSAHIYVVEPYSLYIRISGDSWYLEKNREYHISLVIADSDDNPMYIPENANFATKVPEEYFKLINKSRNGAKFHVKAMKSGTASIQATFVSVVDQDGNERRMPSSVRGEATATISDPIEIVPSFVAFPYVDVKTIHSQKLTAKGGTGSFVWSSVHSEIASVDPNGILLSGKLGETEIFARDVQNNAHSGKAIVQVVQPTGIGFGKSRVEAEVGTDLTLYVKLWATGKFGEISIMDCRHVEFLIKIMDNSIFKMKTDGTQEKSPYGDGCSSFVLTALASGDTTVMVQFGNMSASLQISAFPPLRLETPTEVLVLLGSHLAVRTVGGPRPWIVDSSKFFSKLLYSKDSNLITDSTTDGHTVTCRNVKGDVAILIVVGNEATSSNPLPARAEVKMRLCCGLPDRLSLSLLRPHQSRCPAGNAVSFSEPSKMVLSAHGRCESGPSMGTEKQFDSLTSLQVKWSINESNLVQAVEEANSVEPHKGCPYLFC
uniref:BIG2 domain-containing protein n=1 Tax=Gongylonema pulchrum TaxID=637853 RepID=A0A183CW81_9BILA